MVGMGRARAKVRVRVRVEDWLLITNAVDSGG